METAMATVGAVLVVAFPAFLALGRTYSRRHRPSWPEGSPGHDEELPDGRKH